MIQNIETNSLLERASAIYDAPVEALRSAANRAITRREGPCVGLEIDTPRGVIYATWSAPFGGRGTFTRTTDAFHAIDERTWERIADALSAGHKRGVHSAQGWTWEATLNLAGGTHWAIEQAVAADERYDASSAEALLKLATIH